MRLEKNVLDLLYLIGCSLNEIVPNGERVAQIDTDAVFKLSQRQGVTAITAHALISAGNKEARWQEHINRSIYRVAMFEIERTNLIDFMEKSGIWYMPLKGIILMNYYPQVYMREMADNDILFDSKFQGKIKEYFVNSGYTVESYGLLHHDTYHKKPMFNFEMHTNLYSGAHNHLLVSYYENVKSRLHKDSDNQFGYHFTDNDFYIHTVSHAYKHFSSSGMGIKLLLDNYVCLKRFGNGLDFSYIEAECKKAGFADFEKLARRTAQIIFSGYNTVELNEDEESLIEYCIGSGTYGNVKNRVANGIMKSKGSKFKYILSRIFPSPKVIYQHFSFVKKCKILLPIGYVLRWIKCLFFRRSTAKAEIREIKKMK